MAMAAAAIMGAQVGSSILGARAAKKAQAAAMEQAERFFQMELAKREEAVRRLEAEGVPPIEAQRIVLETPEVVGLEQLPPELQSRMAEVTTDPRLKEAQMGALEQMQQLSQSGLTPGEAAAQELSLRQARSGAAARDAAIRQDLAERGQLSGGAEIAMRQIAGQQGAQNASDAALQAQAQAQQRALQALAQSGQMSGQIRGQDFSEAAQKASAADAIARYNQQNTSETARRNLERQQQAENLRASARQQEEIANKGLLAQDYQNRMAKAQAVANAKIGQAGAYSGAADRAMKSGAAAAQGASSMWQGIGQGAQAAGLGYMAYKGSGGGGGGSNTTSAPINENVAYNYQPTSGQYVAKDGGVIKKKGDDSGSMRYADGGTADFTGSISPITDEELYKGSTRLSRPASSSFDQYGPLTEFPYEKPAPVDIGSPSPRMSSRGRPMAMSDFQKRALAMEPEAASGFDEAAKYVSDYGDEVADLSGGMRRSALKQGAKNLAKGVGKGLLKSAGLAGAAYSALDQPEAGPESGSLEYHLENGRITPQQYEMLKRDPDFANMKFDDGGIAIIEAVPKKGRHCEEMMEEGEAPEMYEPENHGPRVPGNSYAGDRVDAKINSGELVLNAPMQQRLVDLLRGYKSLKDFQNEAEDVIVPADGSKIEDNQYQDYNNEFRGGGMAYNYANGGKVDMKHESYDYENKTPNYEAIANRTPGKEMRSMGDFKYGLEDIERKKVEFNRKLADETRKMKDQYNEEYQKQKKHMQSKLKALEQLASR